MNRALLNTYYICLPNRDPILWRALDPLPEFSGRTLYFSGVLQAMDESLGQGGLTVYLTWDLQALPSYGPDVVAVVLGDEWGRIPSYSDRVLAVFKTFGISFELTGNVFRNPSYLNFVSLVRYLRTQVYRMPGLLRYWAKSAAMHGSDDNIFPIPLGYANQEDLPLKPLEQRAYDVYFSGSIDNKRYPAWSPQRWLQTPKSVSRRQMVASLKQLQTTHPELRIELDITSRFTLRLHQQGEWSAERRSYSEELMDTVICVVPRGTTAETCRFYEGLRYGCIMIAEELPSRWFYDGAPVIQVGDWRELEQEVSRIMADADRMHELHEASLGWWREKCSEAAVGDYMAEALKGLRNGGARAIRQSVLAQVAA